MLNDVAPNKLALEETFDTLLLPRQTKTCNFENLNRVDRETSKNTLLAKAIKGFKAITLLFVTDVSDKKVIVCFLPRSSLAWSNFRT